MVLGCVSLNAQRLIEAGEGFSSTSVNTAVFRKNSVVSHGKYQFIAYYDANGYLTLGRRNLSDNHFEIQRTQYKGKCSDGHNIISMGIDGKGYLHLSFNHHNVPLQYCKSKAPYSLELDTLQNMVGRDELRVTYPEFYTMPNGDLLFAYRLGKSGQGNLVLNRYDVKHSTWNRLQDVLIDGEGERNAYWQICVDNRGTIHVSWVWRETSAVETNHDLCYARSVDGGVTWQKSTGERYTLPINQDNAEYAYRIPQNSELINQTSMSVDVKGNPYIATYWRDAGDSIPQYRVVYKSDGEWNMQCVSRRKTPFSLSGRGTKMIPIARPQIAIDKKKIYYVFRDVERGSRVSMAFTRNLSHPDWQVCDLTSFDVDAWEPSYDTNLWNKRHKLHIFVQKTSQGDGEKVKLSAPQPVYVMEVE
jgi:hypothetical protein